MNGHFLAGSSTKQQTPIPSSDRVRFNAVTLRVGRYETLRPIASGGMATVYLGRAVGAGGFERLVAIKVMHAHTAREPDFINMFLDEARLAARVRHPNVVATIDLVEDPLFLVMEYIEGPSLQLLLRTCKKLKRPFPIGVALRIFLDMLSGLHAAHDLTGTRGEPLLLVHRDVSPQNVLVGVDGVSRITDFGVARAESRISSTRGGTLKGKLGYMSTEQIMNKQIDRRSDIYAAGVVLWEMLTEQRLFKADNEGAMIAMILAGPPRSPRVWTPGVPVALDRACMRALHSDPDERYPTAAVFADAIEQAVAASPGIAIASPRMVAALIKSLNLHGLPEEIVSTPSSREGSSSGLVRPPKPAAHPSPLSPVPIHGAGFDALDHPESPPLGSMDEALDNEATREATTREAPTYEAATYEAPTYEHSVYDEAPTHDETPSAKAPQPLSLSIEASDSTNATVGLVTPAPSKPLLGSKGFLAGVVFFSLGLTAALLIGSGVLGWPTGSAGSTTTPSASVQTTPPTSSTTAKTSAVPAPSVSATPTVESTTEPTAAPTASAVATATTSTTSGKSTSSPAAPTRTSTRVVKPQVPTPPPTTTHPKPSATDFRPGGL